jgi:hypothetical protein
VGFQVFLLVATLFAPLPVAAVDPSPSPDPSASAPADPTPDPAPVATPDPTPDPTAAPAATPDPTVAPNPTTAPAPDPTVAPDPTTVPAPDPTAAPDPSSAPSADPATPAPDPTTAPTSDPSTAPVYHPTIASDLADYPPGGLVTLTGTGWQPGESVHIFVNDDWGSSWSRNVDVVADASGQIVDSFNLPNWFVATYSVVATGPISGAVTTSFTDASLRLMRSPLGSPPNLSFVISGQGYSDNSCTTTTSQSGSSTATVNTDAGTTALNLANNAGNSYVKLTAPASPASPSGWSFKNWSSGTGSDNAIASTTTASICVRNPQNSQNDIYVATYESASVTTSTSISRTAGTSPATYGDSLTFTATVTGSTNPNSVGTVTFRDGVTAICTSVALAGNAASCSPTLSAGSHSITAEYSGTSTGTPTFTGSTSAALAQSITAKGIVITPDSGQSKVYGAADPTLTFTNLPALLSGDSFSGALSRAAGSNVGNYAINLGTLSAGSNYSLSLSATPVNFAISPAALTITANDRTKTYGDTVTFAGTEFGTSGLVNSDTVASVTLTSAGAAATAQVSGSPYDITPSAAVGTGLANYTISYVNGKLTVSPKALSITANDRSKVLGETVTFDETTPSTDFSVVGLVNSDTVASVTLTSAGAAATAQVSGSPYDITPSAAVGTGLANYTITYVNGKLSVLYSTGACLGSPGHQILQPINANWSVDLSVYKQGSTVPAKFRVCDANGTSVGVAGTVLEFKQSFKSTLPPDAQVDETVVSTTPDTAFRWSSTDQQWIYNISTKNLAKNTTYGYRITLADHSIIEFRFGLR